MQKNEEIRNEEIKNEEIEHYFAKRPKTKRKTFVIDAVLLGKKFRFLSDSSIFSKKKIDYGTSLLINQISKMDIKPSDIVLDLGCGYGAIGIAVARFAKKVYLTDINERAVEITKNNLIINNINNAEVRCGNLFEPVAEISFDKILTNPPIRAGKKIVFKLIEESKKYLNEGGSLWLVARTKQGAKSIKKKMEEVFGNATYASLRGGYRVITSYKNNKMV